MIEYRKILEKYKNSSAVSDALYKIGMSFYQLKYCTVRPLVLTSSPVASAATGKRATPRS